jgi:hypothetical protein
MTLEHISETKKFLSMIRKNIGDNNTKLFIQVPNVKKILKDLAFWDIYYEHCSYFNTKSLNYLLNSTGFKIINQWYDYNDQYIFITAEPKNNLNQSIKENNSITMFVDKFRKEIIKEIEKWKDFFIENKDNKIVIWGGGSKAVAFITTLHLENEIDFIIDVNPRKKNTYLPGTGHLIVNPEYLKKYQTDILIVMNPIYTDEIKKDLKKLGENPKINLV